MNEIELSKDFQIKLLKAIFEGREIKNWIQSFYCYMIDSKYRVYKRLDTFLKEQLENPHSTLVAKAKELRKATPDETIVNVLRFVRSKIKYKYDSNNYGKAEYWATAIETLEKGNDDCDGINGLIYILARLAGIPSYLLYSCIGDVAGGGHFWLVYYSTKFNKLTAIDGTYYPNLSDMQFRTKFDFTIQTYHNIWYIFNDSFVFKPLY